MHSYINSQHNIVTPISHYHYIPNKCCRSFISMAVSSRCGDQYSKELRLNFFAVTSFSIQEGEYIIRTALLRC